MIHRLGWKAKRMLLEDGKWLEVVTGGGWNGENGGPKKRKQADSEKRN